MTDRPAAPASTHQQPAPAAPVRRIAELLLVVLTGLVLAHLVWLWIDPASRLTQPEAGPAPITQKTKPLVKQDFSILTRFDPFNRSQRVATPEASTDAPETSLDLKLFGVRLSAEPEHSSAIIQSGGGAQAVFRPGDEILPGVRLDRVYKDRISLSRSGVIESLPIEGSNAALISGTASPSAPRPAPVAMNGLIALFKQVTLAPVREGQRTTGWRIDAVKDAAAAALATAGLETGDVLISLNGQSLSNPEILSETLSDPGTAGALVLEIERAGKRQTVTLSPMGTNPESNPA